MIFRAAGLSARSRATEEDVLSLVEDVEEDALIDENQREMISGVFELDDIEAGEIMTHRTEVEAVEDDQLVCEVIPQAREKGFPACRSIIGIWMRSSGSCTSRICSG